jgi:hypothetical protein
MNYKTMRNTATYRLNKYLVYFILGNENQKGINYLYYFFKLLIKLKNEESKSKQMQEYLDYLLFEIMSKHPEILEKKNSKTSTKR